MKKILIIICFTFVVCGLSYWIFKKEIHQLAMVVKKNTLLSIVRKSLDVDKLKSKTAGENSAWMQAQLDEDFGPFAGRMLTTKDVDCTYKTILQKCPPGTSHMWIRYRIIDRKLYRLFLDGQPISMIDNYIERSLKILCELFPLSDMDLVIGFEDGMPLEHMTRDFWITPNFQDQAPVFISAKKMNTPYVILIPDWRSVSWHWVRDIHAMLKNGHPTPWDEKVNSAIWRGSLTKNIRRTLCEISQDHFSDLDAKLSIKVEDPLLQEELEKKGLFGKFISTEEFLKHKYLPILDGVMCAAPALQWRLLSNCLTLKQESDEIQWFYKGIKPYVHYVPVKNDLSDIIQQIEWSRVHDQECLKISQHAYAFAFNNLLIEDVYHYFYKVLESYGKMQKIDGKELLAQMQEDPHWILLESRSTRKQKLRKNQTTVEAMTPY